MMRPAKIEHAVSARLCSCGGSQLETGTTPELKWTTQTYGSRLQARLLPQEKAHTCTDATTVPANGSYLGRGDRVIVKVSPAFLSQPGIRRWHDDIRSLACLHLFPKFQLPHFLLSFLSSKGLS